MAVNHIKKVEKYLEKYLNAIACLMQEFEKKLEALEKKAKDLQAKREGKT